MIWTVGLLFSHQVMSSFLWPPGLQHARPPCPSPSPRVCPSSCSLNCDAIQPSHPPSPSSLSAFQSFPASESFLISWLFAAGGQNIRTLASASVIPVSIQGWFPLVLNSLISLLSKGLSRVFSNTTIQKAFCLLYGPTLTSVHDYWKDHSLDYVSLCQQSDVFAF